MLVGMSCPTAGRANNLDTNTARPLAGQAPAQHRRIGPRDRRVRAAAQLLDAEGPGARAGHAWQEALRPSRAGAHRAHQALPERRLSAGARRARGGAAAAVDAPSAQPGGAAAGHRAAAGRAGGAGWLSTAAIGSGRATRAAGVHRPHAFAARYCWAAEKSTAASAAGARYERLKTGSQGMRWLRWPSYLRIASSCWNVMPMASSPLR